MGEDELFEGMAPNLATPSSLMLLVVESCVGMGDEILHDKVVSMQKELYAPCAPMMLRRHDEACVCAGL